MDDLSLIGPIEPRLGRWMLDRLVATPVRYGHPFVDRVRAHARRRSRPPSAADRSARRRRDRATGRPTSCCCSCPTRPRPARRARRRGWATRLRRPSSPGSPGTATSPTTCSSARSAAPGRSTRAEALEALGEPAHAELARGRGAAGASRSARPAGSVDRRPSRSVAMSLNERSSSACSISARRTDGFSRIAPRITCSRSPLRCRRSAAVLAPMPLAPGQPVGRVAAQRDEVRHLLGPDRRSARAPRPAPSRRGPPARALQQHVHVLGRALEHVAVAGEDQRRAARLAPRPARASASGRRPRASAWSSTFQPSAS